jgi:hypothetical protein
MSGELSAGEIQLSSDNLTDYVEPCDFSLTGTERDELYTLREVM